MSVCACSFTPMSAGDFWAFRGEVFLQSEDTLPFFIYKFGGRAVVSGLKNWINNELMYAEENIQWVSSVILSILSGNKNLLMK